MHKAISFETKHINTSDAYPWLAFSTHEPRCWSHLRILVQDNYEILQGKGRLLTNAWQLRIIRPVVGRSRSWPINNIHRVPEKTVSPGLMDVPSYFNPGLSLFLFLISFTLFFLLPFPSFPSFSCLIFLLLHSYFFASSVRCSLFAFPGFILSFSSFCIFPFAYIHRHVLSFHSRERYGSEYAECPSRCCEHGNLVWRAVGAKKTQ